MRFVRAAAITLFGSAAIWLIALALFGWLGADCQRRALERRLAEKMRADVTIGRLELGLVRGAIALEDVAIDRRELGSLHVEIDRVDAAVLPLGLALVQDGVGHVRIRGVRMAMTALGALDFRGGEGEPLHFDSVVIEDASFRLIDLPFPVFEWIAVRVDRASADATTLRTPMSWLFALRELDVTLVVPGDHELRLSYANGVVEIRSTLVDGTVMFPFPIPPLEPDRELEQLAELGRQFVQLLGVEIMRSLTTDQPR